MACHFPVIVLKCDFLKILRPIFWGLFWDTSQELHILSEVAFLSQSIRDIYEKMQYRNGRFFSCGTAYKMRKMWILLQNFIEPNVYSYLKGWWYALHCNRTSCWSVNDAFGEIYRNGKSVSEKKKLWFFFSGWKQEI